MTWFADHVIFPLRVIKYEVRVFLLVGGRSNTVVLGLLATATKNSRPAPFAGELQYAGTII